MERLEFDMTKIKKVSIEEVRPNSWNPKEHNQQVIDWLKQSIQIMGFKQPLSVRQNDGYEILDGEQRYKAMLELGAKEIYIYDNGEVADKDAMSETINWQIQVPFDDIKLAPLIVKLDDMGVALPYTRIDIDNYREMANFDFSQYDPGAYDNQDDSVKTLNIKMNETAYSVVMEAINKVKQENNCNDSRAIELICADYLGG